jgi:hypothetical protein
MRKHIKIITLVCLAVVFFGCEKAYYGTMEALGIEKREILVDRVEEAKDSQQQAKEQFQSALEEFSAVVKFDGGQLEEKYNKLKNEYEDSEKAAKNVSDRISDVERVSKALFAEWENELTEYTNDNLRKQSAEKLEQTQRRYNKLISVMKRAEDKIEPVLSAFKDQVLFLKHNLNAQAISSLQQEFGNIETDINILIAEMQESIDQAQKFIDQMQSE